MAEDNFPKDSIYGPAHRLISFVQSAFNTYTLSGSPAENFVKFMGDLTKMAHVSQQLWLIDYTYKKDSKSCQKCAEAAKNAYEAKLTAEKALMKSINPEHK
jgi:hypothetical protein